MEDIDKLFEREIERLNYLYAKANTKSKKKKLTYDLMFFEDMYNYLIGSKVVFPWSFDDVLMEVRCSVNASMVRNTLDEQVFLIDLFEKSFNIFTENRDLFYKDYGKQYHKIDWQLLQRYIIGLYGNIDSDLVYKFDYKLDNNEVFINNSIEDKFVGLFFPIESISKNVIFITTKNKLSIEEGRILVHEMGHNYEIENALKNGVDNIWNKIVRTIYPEVSSSFFEYAYINYLIENNLYKDDAMMMKRRYLNQIYYYLSYALIILSHRELNIDSEFCVKLENSDIVKIANDLLTLMNSSDDRFKIGDRINFRSPFVYGVAKLLAIYIYDAYKNNPKDFLNNFKKTLLCYKDIGIDAFSYLGITRESLVCGSVLKKSLNSCK